MTIVCSLLYVNRTMEAVKELEAEEISCEVIDPRTIVPLDMDTIVESVKKTGRIVVVHEGHTTMGMGTEIVASVTQKAFQYLDAPPERLGAKMCTLPFNLALENAVVPQKEEIKAAVERTLYR